MMLLVLIVRIIKLLTNGLKKNAIEKIMKTTVDTPFEGNAFRLLQIKARFNSKISMKKRFGPISKHDYCSGF